MLSDSIKSKLTPIGYIGLVIILFSSIGLLPAYLPKIYAIMQLPSPHPFLGGGRIPKYRPRITDSVCFGNKDFSLSYDYTVDRALTEVQTYYETEME